MAITTNYIAACASEKDGNADKDRLQSRNKIVHLRWSIFLCTTQINANALRATKQPYASNKEKKRLRQIAIGNLVCQFPGNDML